MQAQSRRGLSAAGIGRKSGAVHHAYVMTIIGADRPGLVELLSNVVAEHGGNWLESRLAHLGGQFAGVLRVQVPAEREVALCNALRALDTEGLTVVVHADQPPPGDGERTLCTLEIVGHDRPGIVKQIARALAQFGVNVEELQTEVASAAMSGEMLFKARGRVSLPPGGEVAALRSTLESIAADLLVDVSLETLAQG